MCPPPPARVCAEGSSDRPDLHGVGQRPILYEANVGRNHVKHSLDLNILLIEQDPIFAEAHLRQDAQGLDTARAD